VFSFFVEFLSGWVISRQQFVPMLGLQNLTFKNEFLESHRPNSSKSENFGSIGFDF